MRKLSAKKLEKLIADRKRRNAAFAKLPKAQKRVVVAKDVLESLRVGKLKARNGRYWLPAKASRLKAAELAAAAVEQQGEFADVLAQIPKCECCAVGSLFMCTVLRADECKIVRGGQETGDAVGFYDDTNVISENAYEYLEKMGIFSKKQLSQMEAAFESGRHGLGRAVFTIKTNRRDVWGSIIYDEVGTSRERLTLIMQNLVRNKGTYKPVDPKFLKAISKLKTQNESYGRSA